MAIPNRVEAYKAALAKTAGRRFDADGKAILTDGEKAMLKGLERADFADGFRQAIGLKIAMKRLEMIFHNPQKLRK